MAYAAVISVKQTIQRLLDSSQIPIISSSREIIEFSYKELESLQQVLKRLDDSSSSERLNDLDGQIRKAVHKFEDLLEFHESYNFFPQSESYGDGVDLEELRQNINSFSETVKELGQDYVEELENPSPETDDEAAVASSIDFGVEMVGLSDEEFTHIKDKLLARVRPDDFGLFSIIGMAGIGRTIVAKTVFEDLYIRQQVEQSFDCGAWATVGPNYQVKEILLGILGQIDPQGSDKLLLEGDDEKIREYLSTSLKGRRYIIVLDDVWDTQTWDLLRRSFPEQNNGSAVLLTTALKEVAVSAGSFYIQELDTVDEELSWDVLRLAMFGKDQSCPREFEEAGKKIVKNCQGGLLQLIKVMIFLLKAEKTPECWNKLAADEQNSIYIVADELSEISKIKEDLQHCNSVLDDVQRTFSTELAINMMDFSDLAAIIKMQFFPKRFFPKMEITSFFGMAGIGKTTLAKFFFEDPSIKHHFDHRVWVTIGPKYQSEEILVDILAQIFPGIDKMHTKGDGELAKDLCSQLSTKRCLIVLDDVWNQEPLYYLKKLFPDIKGEVLVTTTLVEVTQFGECDRFHEMRFLDEEESWLLLHRKVFAKELCPPELEKPGKKIAENCEGLPLLILTIANLLSKVEKTPEYWNKVAEKQNSVFMNAYNDMSKALLPSYKNLPQYLKACFLYMGVFSENYKIPTSKLTKLWIAEGFLEPNPSQTVEAYAALCLLELVYRSLVIICQKGANFVIKTCRLHTAFWHLSNSEAVKNNFFHAFNSYADNFIEGMKSQRRLCIRNSILLGIKDVRNSMPSISTAHSLLCIGPPHQYPVPVCFGFRLLRVLDALTICLYEFPIEVLKLVQLRYLALTCNNGELPVSISKLWNLQFLIICQYLSIKSPKDQPYLPMEIWNMKKLKHIQIRGSKLPNPECGALLPNLLTLLDVSAESCTKEVLESVPNLKTLGIRIELAPDDDGKLSLCLNHISHLHKLESLKCIVMNPEIKFEAPAPPYPTLIFPSGLIKLCLSGLGYPWEYMSIIASLKNLEVLKLQCYAFRGPTWVAKNNDFSKVRFLTIEDTDLVCWKIKLASFLELVSVTIRHCYMLEELPKNLPSVEMIHVVDCNPLAVAWAKEMEREEPGTSGVQGTS